MFGSARRISVRILQTLLALNKIAKRLSPRIFLIGFLFLIVLSANTSSAVESEFDKNLTPICMKGVIRWTEWNKVKTEKVDYCFNNERNTLISKNCLNKKCLVYSSLALVKNVPLQVFSQNANPGFNLCIEIGGVPKIIEFYDTADWYKLNRCYFEKDHSFIDVGYLISEWKED
jgi:hypothetical protein